MVNSIKILSKPQGYFSYMRKSNPNLAFLYKKLEKGVNFKPGLNYLIGENGSGKSTLLDILRSANRCLHSFIPQKDFLAVTTLRELSELFSSFEIKEDYRYAVFNLYRMFEDKQNIGSSDILDNLEKVQTYLSGRTESKGQNLMGDLSTLCNWMFQRQEECFPVLQHLQQIHTENPFKVGNEHYKTEHTSTAVLEKVFSNQVDSDPTFYTILMDEPDQGLDVKNLKEIYTIVSHIKPCTQLIVSLHNPLLIYKLCKQKIPANWIETSEGYLDRVVKEVEKFLKDIE